MAAPAAAQFFAFGQNKIQYRQLDWRVTARTRMSICTTIPPKPSWPRRRWRMPRQVTTRSRCSSDTRSLPAFRSSFTPRTPTSSRPTSCRITPPEGLLGATDFLKRRVSLPFQGNFAEFRHTIRHEMVHVFQLDLDAESYHQAPRASRINFPLWWTEGWPSSGRLGRTRATRW